jgi:hypothetical protein
MLARKIATHMKLSPAGDKSKNPNPYFPVTGEHKRNITITVPVSLHILLNKEAAERGMPLNHMLCSWIKPHTDEIEKKAERGEYD